MHSGTRFLPFSAAAHPIRRKESAGLIDGRKNILKKGLTAIDRSL